MKVRQHDAYLQNLHLREGGHSILHEGGHSIQQYVLLVETRNACPRPGTTLSPVAKIKEKDDLPESI